jgi:CHAT domain-containing protein
MERNIGDPLVILAACQSATGHAEAEGVIGLAWSFFLSGARGVVASDWRVDAAATSDLFRRFHQEYARGSRAADALRAAQVSELHSSGHAHPFYWGAFLSIGE